METNMINLFGVVARALPSHRLRQMRLPGRKATIALFFLATTITSTIYATVRTDGPAVAAVPSNISTDRGYNIPVGLNSKFQKGPYVAVYDDCEPALKIGDVIMLTNESDSFSPTVILSVDKVIQRNNDTSAGVIFVSKEATVRLGIFKRNPGIQRLTMRKVWSKGASASASSIQLNIPINFTPIKLGLAKR